MHDVAIVSKGVSVVRDQQTILGSVSFMVPVGTITGLVGPSGSGKTTLMRAIMGAQRLAAGTLRVLDEPAGSAVLRSNIGYVTQAPAIYDDLTTYQNLHYFARILGADEGDIERAMSAVDLMPQAKQIVGSMSGGQRTRVSLAIALLGEPALLVLDEPTVGLDPVLRRSLWKLFRKLAADGRTLVISSHVMDEAEQCSNILLLRDGRVLHQGTKEFLLAYTHTKTVEAAFLKLAGDSNHES
jgi:ABC-type multidrug transport system ATPase subunit